MSDRNHFASVDGCINPQLLSKVAEHPVNASNSRQRTSIGATASNTNIGLDSGSLGGFGGRYASYGGSIAPANDDSAVGRKGGALTHDPKTPTFGDKRPLNSINSINPSLAEVSITGDSDTEAGSDDPMGGARSKKAAEAAKVAKDVNNLTSDTPDLSSSPLKPIDEDAYDASDEHGKGKAPVKRVRPSAEPAKRVAGRRVTPSTKAKARVKAEAPDKDNPLATTKPTPFGRVPVQVPMSPSVVQEKINQLLAADHPVYRVDFSVIPILRAQAHTAGNKTRSIAAHWQTKFDEWTETFQDNRDQLVARGVVSRSRKHDKRSSGILKKSNVEHATPERRAWLENAEKEDAKIRKLIEFSDITATNFTDMTTRLDRLKQILYFLGHGFNKLHSGNGRMLTEGDVRLLEKADAILEAGKQQVNEIVTCINLKPMNPDGTRITGAFTDFDGVDAGVEETTDEEQMLAEKVYSTDNDEDESIEE